MKKQYARTILVLITVFIMIMSTGMASPSYAEKDKSELTAEQKNSVAMLNYLTVLTAEINESKNSRLYLENVYSSLINTTNPEAVDVKTQTRLDKLLDTIENYRMIDVKRDRLQYIYEQNRAKAVRSAVPNPLGLLSATNSMSLTGIAASALYMTVDSVTSYKSTTNELDMKYLEDGWALDDEQAKNVHEMRKSSFNYMIEIVRDNKLPGELALTEKSVDSFVKLENKESSPSKLQSLESEKETYKAFGRYWLALAKAYYDDKEYKKCLNSISKYEKLKINIFREDHGYADALPMAIASLNELYAKNKVSKADYIKKVNRYANEILDNAGKDDWSLRYFVAQAYIDLSSVTGDSKYLKKAYNIALDNANNLVDSQNNDNKTYMSEVEERDVPKEATKQEKKDIKQYNKLIKEERKMELPPVNEALSLNCDLLFSLADKIDISKKDKKRIDGILHEDGKPLFLVKPLDDSYWFSKKGAKGDNLKIEYDKDQIIIPAEAVSDNSGITVTVADNSGESKITDWKVKKVKRSDENDIDTFKAYYESEKMKDVSFSEDTKVQLVIDPNPGSICNPIKRDYVVDDYSKVLFVERVKFREDK